MMEHENIMEEVRAMMLVNSADLLPCHRRLLEQNFQHLGEGSTVNRLQWLEPGYQCNSNIGIRHIQQPVQLKYLGQVDSY